MSSQHKSLVCDARSQCRRRRNLATQGMVIRRAHDPMETTAPGMERVPVLVMGDAYVSPCLFCPFCGRPTNYTARFAALQLGLVQ